MGPGLLGERRASPGRAMTHSRPGTQHIQSSHEGQSGLPARTRAQGHTAQLLEASRLLRYSAAHSRVPRSAPPWLPPPRRDFQAAHPLTPRQSMSPGDTCRVLVGTLAPMQTGDRLSLPRSFLLPLPLYGCSSRRWSQLQCHPLGPGPRSHPHSSLPEPPLYFLALILSVIFGPVYFVSPIPSSSPPFLPSSCEPQEDRDTVCLGHQQRPGFLSSELLTFCE